jgi:hypothetical protein
LDAILKFDDPPDIVDWKAFCKKLKSYRTIVLKLLNDAQLGNSVDLTQFFSDEGGMSVPYDIIATESFISWEGSMEQATLFAHPIIMTTLENYMMPFQDYIETVGKCPQVSVDYPNVFEWMSLKRFQELFSSPGRPRLLLPDFFGTSLFGSYDSVAFSQDVRRFPKITIRGGWEASLDAKTAHPDIWGFLLDLIGPDPICLKPQSQSASSDALLIGRATIGQRQFILTVGLASKNYLLTGFSPQNLDSECLLFNRMFANVDCSERHNILFICCTNYSAALSSMFRGKLFYVHKSSKYAFINEIILLNLSTKENRAKFFGVQGDSSNYVQLIVETDEVEFHQKDV